jgi:hypothetical protein
MQEQEGAKSSARADLVSGGLFVVIGAAIAVGSWRMDRLASQGVEWFTAPGLLPGILGVMIVLAALLIVVRAFRRGDFSRTETAKGSLGRAALTLALCLGFAAGLVGHGVPFWLAASTYLFLHIFLLQLPERRASGQIARAAAGIARSAMLAAAIALGAGVGISLIFQEVFLVRLP